MNHLLEQLRVHLGLEWIYEDWRFSQAADSESKIAGQDSEGATATSKTVQVNSLSLNSKSLISDQQGLSQTPNLIAPPQEEIAVLFDLAMRGNINGILEQATKLEQLDDKFLPFVSKLRQLAKRFQTKQIREFLKPYTSSHE